MNFSKVFAGVLALGAVGMLCSYNAAAREIEIPSFPYESYMVDSAKVGDDGDGFAAISNRIRYPELQKSESLSGFADSLLLLYSTALAFNTLSYDVATAERYFDSPEVRDEFSKALDSINTSGIQNDEIRNALLAVSKNAGALIGKGEQPSETDSPEMGVFYDHFNRFMQSLLGSHDLSGDVDPTTIIEGYDRIHRSAISDSMPERDRLLEMVLMEEDFQKKCVLAREFAYANFKSAKRDDKLLIAVIDPILQAGEYSPLLDELWLMWRTALQRNLIGNLSNDGPMFNLFYNDMKNKVAAQYINHLNRHPEDEIALNRFLSLAMALNITRNSPCLFGNNSMLDEMSLYGDL